MRKSASLLLLLFLGLNVLTVVSSFGQGSTIDFRKESIYFLLPTRFFDGDPTNNRPNEWCSYGPGSPAITDPNDVPWRGDFKGLIQKLDYIKDLGFTAIWITPVVQNRSPLDYHGYHAWDFTKVDPRLESPGATFQDLINEVHARGMKIVLDIVTNHSSRYGIKGVAELKYNTDPTKSWYAADNPNWSYDGLTPNPQDGKIWSRANLAKMPAPYNSNLANYNWPSTESFVNTSDANWFHHSGNGFVQGWDDTLNLYQRGIADDCPDLNTGSPAVRDYLYNAYAKFITMGVDAFRWDTMKHMNKGDAFALMDRFKALNPNLFIFAEVAQKRFDLHSVQEINPHWYTWRGGVGNSAPSGMNIIDFYAEATFHTVFEEGQNLSQVQAAARYDNLYADPSYNVTWLDNHDFGPNNDWNHRYGGSPENLAACMNFMFTWRGIPAVYYGTEVQFMRGAFTDIHDAAGVSQSLNLTGRAYYGDQFAAAPNHRIYQHIKKLNAIRKAVPALQNGSWYWAGSNSGNGVGYVRKSGSSEVAVGLAKDGAVSFNFTGLTNGIYRDAVTGNAITVSNGSLSFSVQPSSAGIYVLNGPGMIGGNGVGYFQPGNDPGLPVASMTPAGGSFASAQQVSLSATGQSTPIKLYYTTNGSTPSATSTLYSAPFSVSANATVKAIAIDAQNRSSAVISNDFYIGPQPGFTVYFKKPAAWGSSVKIYWWNVVPSSALAVAAWPGTAMSYDAASGWYSYRFNNVSSSSIIFNDGTNQTVDLSRNTDGWYSNGTWYASNPDGVTNTPPVVTVNPAGPYTSNAPFTVQISSSDNSGVAPTLYYTLDGSTPTTSSTSATGSASISISASKTLKVYAVDNQGLASAVQTHAYTINAAPVVSVSPAGPYSSTSAVTVTLNASDDSGLQPTLYYTLDGSTPSTSSPSAVGTKSLSIASTSTLKVMAVDNLGLASAVQSHTYTITPASSSFTVYFKKPSNWGSTVRIYWWNVVPTSALAVVGWPGTAMSYNATTGWYSYTFNNVTSTSLIFNDGTNQTADLSRSADGWYTNGTWSATNPDAAQPGFTVYFKKPTNWGSAVKVYWWNVVPSSALAVVGWPGTAMTYDATSGWYSYRFNNVTSTSLIFNDGTSQTADLTRNADGWYYNGAWTATRPAGVRMGEAEFSSSVDVYPNPARDFATVDLRGVSETALLRYQLVNTLGQTVQQGELFGGEVRRIELNTLPSGSYTFLLQEGTKRTMRRLMVQQSGQ